MAERYKNFCMFEFSKRHPRPNAKYAIPFWVRVNCDNTISQLEFIYSENELEMPYIMEKLPSHHYIKPSN